MIKALKVDPVTLVVDKAKPEVSASAQKSSSAGDQDHEARHELNADVEGEKASAESKRSEVVTGLAPLPGVAPPIKMRLPLAPPPSEPSEPLELLPTANSVEVSGSEEGTMNTADEPKVKVHISSYRIPYLYLLLQDHTVPTTPYLPKFSSSRECPADQRGTNRKAHEHETEPCHGSERGT